MAKAWACLVCTFIAEVIAALTFVWTEWTDVTTVSMGLAFLFWLLAAWLFIQAQRS
jgi:hypothetical protein